MKVGITTTVEIDKDAWVANYGCADADVRDDVKQYVQSLITEHLLNMGVLRQEES